MLKNFNIHNLSQSLDWWLNFINSVGRNYIVSESTLKLPIAEFLETINKSDLELEYNHPEFSTRRIDLFFKDIVNDKAIAFEFKYINQNSTLKKSEKQRILNDLMRLKLFPNNDKKTYFIICGNTDYFNSYFQRIKSPSKKLTTQNNDRFISYGFYNKWFSFDLKNPVRKIQLNHKNKNYNVLYKDFERVYLTPLNKNNLMPIYLETQLIYLSPDISIKYTLAGTKLGVWEVL